MAGVGFAIVAASAVIAAEQEETAFRQHRNMSSGSWVPVEEEGGDDGWHRMIMMILCHNKRAFRACRVRAAGGARAASPATSWHRNRSRFRRSDF